MDDKKFYSRFVFGITSVLLLVGLLVLGGCSQNPAKKEVHLILLELTASDCSSCLEIHRIIQDLRPMYEHKMTFVALDLSSTSHKLNARETAREFNSVAFVRRHQDRPGTVAVINAVNGRVLEKVENNTERQRYMTMIDSALKKASAPW